MNKNLGYCMDPAPIPPKQGIALAHVFAIPPPHADVILHYDGTTTETRFGGSARYRSHFYVTQDQYGNVIERFELCDKEVSMLAPVPTDPVLYALLLEYVKSKAK